MDSSDDDINADEAGQLSDELKSRLTNWKFEQARYVMTKPGDTSVVPDHWRETIQALADTYGNSGRFEGSQGQIVRAALSSLDIYE